MVHEAAELRELRHEDVGVHDDGDGGGGGGGASVALDGGRALVLKGWESLDCSWTEFSCSDSLTVISNGANIVNSLNGHRRNKMQSKMVYCSLRGLPCMYDVCPQRSGIGAKTDPNMLKNQWVFLTF